MIIKNTICHWVHFFILIIVILLLSVMPLFSFRVTKNYEIIAFLPVIIIFYTAIFFHFRFSLILILIYGSFIDISWGIPIGISTLLLTLNYIYLIKYRNIFYNKAFVIIYYGFIINITIYLALEHLIIYSIYEYYINPYIIIGQLLVTITIYPFMHGFLGFLYTKWQKVSCV